ncbi:peptide chain release factor 2 [Carnobacteriaceae bacterium zg-ZUI78]|uniref:peptide chain release factor 2 n=1 Tax=Granulicatella sp. zg-84 TaxID=2678503 RepID=UPI0013BEC6D9|nr:peptide chain release factor 2 [Granulicatella sp. zg-84]MBS4750760.1 peptide chain release factor 2 [Carnobacteriaceae bacterium zg-ZUI78]NEW66693.1 peptide chain release factor 2 [Granulicatella sp. zg-84]QMI85988.1 peptide chain release factor 2 [Carnobacteriaceae bacterium zg-84]
MELVEIKQFIEKANNQLVTFGTLFDLERLEVDIADYEHQMLAPDFWDDNEKAKKIIDSLNQKKQAYDTYHRLYQHYQDVVDLYDLVKMEPDELYEQELQEQVRQLQEELMAYELQMLLDGEHDKRNAILEIHPGAGGTESQDWGSMLLRMYTRWADKKGFQVETLDYQDGEEAGIKSVSLLIKGINAYGYLKAEKGVHRLVRISPFDAAKKRHTSFASVDVMPEIDDDVEVEISTEDLRIDTYRASGAGGQHVNKTSSAIRITHIPTGIVVQSQSQRSQFQNKDQAMRMLKAKLYQLEEEKRLAELDTIRGEQKEIGWGSQIRSYVFHPYSMVKDHRTNFSVGQTQAVMDGDLDAFIDAYLKLSLQEPSEME